jgi:hypothetical protein
VGRSVRKARYRAGGVGVVGGILLPYVLGSFPHVLVHTSRFMPAAKPLRVAQEELAIRAEGSMWCLWVASCWRSSSTSSTLFRSGLPGHTGCQYANSNACLVASTSRASSERSVRKVRRLGFGCRTASRTYCTGSSAGVDTSRSHTHFRASIREAEDKETRKVRWRLNEPRCMIWGIRAESAIS